MTRDVLPGSRNKRYDNQRELVADHAARTGLDYPLAWGLRGFGSHIAAPCTERGVFVWR